VIHSETYCFCPNKCWWFFTFKFGKSQVCENDISLRKWSGGAAHLRSCAPERGRCSSCCTTVQNHAMLVQSSYSRMRKRFVSVWTNTIVRYRQPRVAPRKRGLALRWLIEAWCRGIPHAVHSFSTSTLIRFCLCRKRSAGLAAFLDKRSRPVRLEERRKNSYKLSNTTNMQLPLCFQKNNLETVRIFNYKRMDSVTVNADVTASGKSSLQIFRMSRFANPPGCLQGQDFPINMRKWKRCWRLTWKIAGAR